MNPYKKEKDMDVVEDGIQAEIAETMASSRTVTEAQTIDRLVLLVCRISGKSKRCPECGASWIGEQDWEFDCRPDCEVNWATTTTSRKDRHRQHETILQRMQRMRRMVGLATL